MFRSRQISHALAVVTLVLLPMAAHATTPPRVPILMYHYIGADPQPLSHTRDVLTVTPQDFEQQLAYLVKKKFTFVTMAEARQIIAGRSTTTKPIVLTFDDGYRDFYTDAFPLLQKYHAKATAFIITGGVGEPAYLTWPQIDEMVKSGLITFGAHTVNHPDLSVLKNEHVFYELKASRVALQRRTGQAVDDLAYPYGRYSKSVEAIAAMVGFSDAVTTHFGQATTTSLAMPRVRVWGHENLESFGKVLER
jgi:peptidoglycan/xylan/chitin deacetylase (PgdA/CDA1 family)